MSKYNDSLKFPNILETELFKLYFTSFNNLDNNIYDLDIDLLNGSYKRYITSITHIIQFLNERKVIEEISVTCKYRKSDNMYQVKFKQHLISNKNTEDEMKQIYDGTRIGFPSKTYVFSKNMKLSFIRFHKNNYIISIVDEENTFKRITLGAMSFNVDNTSNVNIEAIVKTIVKTDSIISLDDMKRLFFIIRAPILNNKIYLKLTNQYRVSISYDKKNKKIYIFDVGIVRIYFDETAKATVYSLTSSPKTKMYVNNKENVYSFSNYQSIY